MELDKVERGVGEGGWEELEEGIYGGISRLYLFIH
jgi:hypothetical protein